MLDIEPGTSCAGPVLLTVSPYSHYVYVSVGVISVVSVVVFWLASSPEDWVEAVIQLY